MLTTERLTRRLWRFNRCGSIAKDKIECVAGGMLVLAMAWASAEHCVAPAASSRDVTGTQTRVSVLLRRLELLSGKVSLSQELTEIGQQQLGAYVDGSASGRGGTLGRGAAG